MYTVSLVHRVLKKHITRRPLYNIISYYSITMYSPNIAPVTFRYSLSFNAIVLDPTICVYLYTVVGSSVEHQTFKLPTIYMI